MTAAGARDKSRPVPAPLATLKRALAGQEGRSRPGSQEMRDMGGGAFHGEAGLEVAPPSSEGPRRVLEGDWEGRADAGSTWRTFPCTQQPQLAGIAFPRVLGRLELRQEIGRLKVDDLFGRGDLGPGAQEPKSQAPLLSALGPWVGIQLQTEGSTSPFSTPQTLKLFSPDCVLLRPGGGGNQG